MCGIVAYVGGQEAFPILIKGLQRLEYRGYDSAGVAVYETGGGINIQKRKGKVQDLLDHVGQALPNGTMGIGHTRWATHGPPNDVNAHPHSAREGRLTLIHRNCFSRQYKPLMGQSEWVNRTWWRQSLRDLRLGATE